MVENLSQGMMSLLHALNVGYLNSLFANMAHLSMALGNDVSWCINTHHLCQGFPVAICVFRIWNPQPLVPINSVQNQDESGALASMPLSCRISRYLPLTIWITQKDAGKWFSWLRRKHHLSFHSGDNLCMRYKWLILMHGVLNVGQTFIWSNERHVGDVLYKIHSRIHVMPCKNVKI